MKQNGVFRVLCGLCVCLLVVLGGCAEQSTQGSKGSQPSSSGSSAPMEGTGSASGSAPATEGSVEKDAARADTKDGEYIPSMANLRLGNPRETVLEELGQDFVEERIGEAPSMGEPIIKWLYPNGLVVVLGEDTGKVLEIETTSPETETNFGFQVGDEATRAIELFENLFEQPVSRHDDEKIKGWFYVRGDEIAIINYDGGDTLLNGELKKDSVITRLKLSRFSYMD